MTLLTVFNNIPDLRRNQAKQYKLAPLLFVSVLAILSGADSYRSIYSFFFLKFKFLSKHLKLHWKDPPSYSTIRRAFLSLDPVTLESVFRKFSTQFISPAQHCLAIDGKTLRSSFDKFHDQKVVQVLTAFLTESKLVIAHQDFTADKTNEIPLAQSMIKELGVQDKIVTLDALHCQKDTFKEVVKSGNQAIIQVKLNQQRLYKHCQKISNNWNPTAICSTLDKEHGRIERRTVMSFQNKSYLPGFFSELIKAVIKVSRNIQAFDGQNWKRTLEESYYVSTVVLNSKEYLKIIRGHWGIENSNNYVRDCSLGEDKSRIRIKPEVMSTLRSFALNILRLNGKVNIKNEIYKNSVDVRLLCKFKFLGF